MHDRDTLWAAFRHSGAADSPPPPLDAGAAVANAAIRHLATAACDLVIIPIEDALALPEQPNFPGTLDEHPNWQRRMPAPAVTLLDTPAVAARLQSLDAARKRS